MYALTKAHKKLIFVFLTQIIVISTGLIDRRAQTLIGQHLSHLIRLRVRPHRMPRRAAPRHAAR